MELLYTSTRGDGKTVSASEAILRGISPDGGLFVPVSVPTPALSLSQMLGLSYQALAFEIMKGYLPDFSDAELKDCIDKAYDDKFSTQAIAPLIKKADALFLELFHGPTLAFKDMALTILPHLMKTAAKKQNIDKEIVILTATSGDTGKAALEGFADVEGTRIVVFFPEDGVSDVQKRQMVTQTGSNTLVVGIQGNFDDAQSGVKQIFTDARLLSRMEEAGFLFSSANSINIGRLVPQIVYYYHAYLQACRMGEIQPGEVLNVVVPTGNFGNILAGCYAKMMGLPLGTLVCASNENKVLYDFFMSGVYDRRREFVTTMSPSMDILISSNLERLLYWAAGEDSLKVRELMHQLAETGCYEITDEMKARLSGFSGGYTSEADTTEAIKRIYLASGYVMDTHTAVAYSVYSRYQRQNPGDDRKAVIVSTASPYKFPADVLKAIDPKYGSIADFQLIQALSSLTATEIPQGIQGLEQRPILHKTVCEKHEMQQVVERFLNLK